MKVHHSDSSISVWNCLPAEMFLIVIISDDNDSDNMSRVWGN